MKTLKILLLSTAALLGATSCADLGLGVDFSSDAGPAIYTNYTNYNPYWGLNPPYSPYWYSPPVQAPRPPIIVGNPGANRPPQQQLPQPSRPQPGNSLPVITPGVNINPSQRPGNNGLPSTSNPPSVPRGQSVR